MAVITGVRAMDSALPLGMIGQPFHANQEGFSAMPLATASPIAMITTRDRKAAEAFYGDTLGLPRKGDDGFAALFDLNGVTLRLTEVPSYAATGHPVLGWEVADMEAAVDALAGRGVAMSIYEGLGQDGRGIWTAPDNSCKVAFFNDPDGNGLSLTQKL